MQTTSALKKHKKSDKWAYLGLTGLWLLSQVITFSIQNTEAIERYDISRGTLHLIQIGFSLPTLFIWLSILYAVLSFYHYAKQIAGSKDADGFRFITYGLVALLAGWVTSSFLNSFRTLLSEGATDPVSVKSNFVILANYVAVLAALATYGYLFKGSKSLLASINSRFESSKQYLIIGLPIAGLAAVYLLLILNNPARRVSSDPAIAPTFALPDSLIILTVALPYVVSWFLGSAALVGLYRYLSKTPGVVYKLLFRKLVVGMTMLISLTIVLQLITQSSGFWASKGLGSILVIITIIYAVLIAALFIVARGAQQLNKIETLELEKGR